MKRRESFRRRQLDDQNVLGLSGWLFTDLLLGLLIVFVSVYSYVNLEPEGKLDEAVDAREAAEGERDVAVDAREAAEGERDVAVDAREAAEEERDVAVDAREAAEEERDVAVDAREAAESLLTTLNKGIEQNPYCIRIPNVGTGSDLPEKKLFIQKRLEQELKDKNLADREVGIALIFAVTVKGENGTGTRGSLWLKKQIEEDLDYPAVFKKAVLRPFLSYDSSDGMVGDIKMDLYMWPKDGASLATENDKECKDD